MISVKEAMDKEKRQLEEKQAQLEKNKSDFDDSKILAKVNSNSAQYSGGDRGDPVLTITEYVG